MLTKLYINSVICMLILGVLSVSLYSAVEKNVDLAQDEKSLTNLHEAQVHGQCVDENGAPLEGAEVILYYNAFPEGWGVLPKELGCGVVSRTKTDAEGNFKFPASLVTYEPKPYLVKHSDRSDRPAGYYLIARHSNRAISAIVLGRGKETKFKKITLYPGFHQKVYAVGPGGKGVVPGARIWLHLIRAGKDGPPEWTSQFALNEDIGLVGGTTDENGECILTNLPPVDCCFFATKEGYAATWRGGIKPPNSGNIWFDMTPGAIVTGRATLPDGSPAARLLVKFLTGGNTTWVPYTVTDDKGNFRSPPLPTHEWDRGAWADLADLHDGLLTVVADQFLDGTPHVSSQPIQIDTHEKMEFEVELKVSRLEAKPLHIKFVVPNGDPLPGYRISFMTYLGRNYEPVDSLVTDKEGIALVELPVQKLHVSPQDSTELAGWYMPDRVSGFDITWTESGWKTGKFSGYPEAFFEMLSGSGTAAEPLVIKANLIPARQVSGIVVDEMGKPVENCSVYSGFKRKEQKTDNQGKFIFPVLPEDKEIELFAITADKKFAGLTRIKGNSSPFEIVLSPTRDYSGKAVDSDGISAGKIFFRTDLLLNSESIYFAREEITTDEEGNFVVHNVCPKATYRFWWSGDDNINRDLDFGRADVKMSDITSANPLRIAAQRYTGCIKGWVVDGYGNLVSGAKIYLSNQNLIRQDGRMGRAETIASDENGNFEIRRLAKGKTALMVTHPDFKGLRLADIPTDSIDVKVVLQPKGDIKVTAKVKDAEGNLIPGAKVILFSRDYKEKDRVLKKEAVTDAHGECSIQRAGEGDEGGMNWSLLCDMPGYYYFCRRVPQGMDCHYDIVLRKITEPLSGTVLGLDSQPLEKAKVRAHYIFSAPHEEELWGGGHDYPEELVTVYTGHDGRFTFPRLSKDDSINFEAVADGYARKVFFSRELTKDGKDIILTLPLGGEITGRVLYAESGRPTAGVKVCAQGAGAHSGWAESMSDSEGRYSLQSLQPGIYNVSVMFVVGKLPEWTVVAYDSISVRAGQPLTGKDLLLIKGVVVAGHVTDGKTGKPLEGIGIGCYSRARPRSGAWCESIRTNQDGKYKFRLPPGEAYIYVQQTGSPSKEIVLEEGKLYDNIDFTVN